jgi:hypothetical protein
MDRETIKTEGCKILRNVLQCVGVNTSIRIPNKGMFKLIFNEGKIQQQQQQQ